METRSGTKTSSQVGVFMPIENLDTENFSAGWPFQIKNDGDEDIFLEVSGWNMAVGTFTKTRFPGGGTWSPEIIREIKKDAALADAQLIWGY